MYALFTAQFFTFLNFLRHMYAFCSDHKRVIFAFDWREEDTLRMRNGHF